MQFDPVEESGAPLEVVQRMQRGPQGGLGGGAPQPPEATVANTCSLWGTDSVVSWVRPPEGGLWIP